jgi:hypothetical protein
MLCSERTQSIYGVAETNSLDSNEACIEISTRHSWIWLEICLWCRHVFARDMSMQIGHGALLKYCVTAKNILIPFCG